MKKLKAILDFIQFTVTAKIAFYRNVIAKLTGNPLFPEPDVPLTEAKTAVDKLEAAVLDAKDVIPETEAGWISAGHSTQSYFQLSGLMVASKYFFRVAAIKPDGITDFTAPVMKVVE